MTDQLREAALSVLAADTALAIGQEGSDRLWDEAMQSLADALASLPAQAVEPYTDEELAATPLRGRLPSAQAVEPGPLDVQRLTSALNLLYLRDALRPEQPVRTHAEDIAREYARLSSDKQPKGAG
jgi:hypothetical protein